MHWSHDAISLSLVITRYSLVAARWTAEIPITQFYRIVRPLWTVCYFFRLKPCRRTIWFWYGTNLVYAVAIVDRSCTFFVILRLSSTRACSDCRSALYTFSPERKRPFNPRRTDRPATITRGHDGGYDPQVSGYYLFCTRITTVVRQTHHRWVAVNGHEACGITIFSDFIISEALCI